MSDLDLILKEQESSITRDNEIQRILSCSPKDYFAILEINPFVDSNNIINEVRKLFRRKSLLIHPDKVKHENAPQAFDLLKKAELILSIAEESDYAEQKDKFIEKSALLYIYERIAESLDVEPNEAFQSIQNVEIRAKVKEALDHQNKSRELERNFLQKQKTKKSEEVQNAAKDRDLRKKWELKWENDRDERVNLWRQYKVDKGKRKKGLKKKPLI